MTLVMISAMTVVRRASGNVVTAAGCRHLGVVPNVDGMTSGAEMQVLTSTRSPEGCDLPDDALISARNVTKGYAAGSRQVEILHGTSLAVRPGELVSVMGPSGSGKSTLLYCLAGLEQPTTGVVSLLGRPTNTMSRGALARMRRDEVGFVFQSYNLMPTLTAYENVALPFRLAGTKPPQERIGRALETVNLGALATSRPAVMSGGEQQRVALARVIAQQPQVVFADEPTGALDTTTGATVLAELDRMARGDGRCVLMVTHDPNVAARSDRVLFLRDGYLVEEALRPTALEVADLMTELTTAARATQAARV